MTQWTETARQAFDRYCARTRQSLAGSGADADEVIDDLRRHVEEEAQSARLTVVTEEDMQRILNRVGDPASGHESPPPIQPPQSRTEPVVDQRRRPGFWLLFLGVIMPTITLGFELVTNASASLLFDPMPTWFHVGLIGLVPVTNFWLWRAGRAQDARHATLLGWLNGITLGVCIWYALLYMAFVPFSALAILAFGAGLIPLGPYFAMLGTPLLGLAYRSRIGVEKRSGIKWGLLLGLGILVALELPRVMTISGISRALEENPATSRSGVNMLRMFGDRELMLRECYGVSFQQSPDFDLVRSVFGGSHNPTAEEARVLYYRVTGQPFNAVPPPKLYTRAGRWTDVSDEFTWDDAQGGESVAGRVKGLSLQSSRLDALVDADGAAVYTEWTLEFHNVSHQQREARTQIALPPGGVVSRLTLWVNGEEREAAFSGRSEVRAAYQKVAVVQRRDPVLVTTCGPDRVLVQCFPVPADGGTMKVRVGITSPLALDTADHGRFCWPRFLERNFGIPGEFKHTLWIESPAQLSADNPAFKAEHPRPNVFALHGSMTEAGMEDTADAVRVERAPEVSDTWTPALEADAIIVQKIHSTTPDPVSRAVIVIDGSIGMKEYATAVAQALGKVPVTVEVKVLMAGDGVIDLNPSTHEALQKEVRSFRYVGGRDNLPALEQAWDLAARTTNGVVVWVHAAQPYLLSSVDALAQRFERGSHAVRLIDLQADRGPSRVTEKLDGLPEVKLAPRFGTVADDLGRLVATWDGRTPVMEITRERMTRPAEPMPGRQVSRHIDRLWARDEAARLAGYRQQTAAATLAARHQLVTPVSGAVVLETVQQYAQNNLNPADPNSVPVIPEPGTWALLALGGVVFLVRKLGGRMKRLSGRD